MAAVQVSMAEARIHLYRLLDWVAAGEDVIVARADEPVARLVAIEPASARRVPGRLLGQIHIAEGFDAPFVGMESVR